MVVCPVILSVDVLGIEPRSLSLTKLAMQPATPTDGKTQQTKIPADRVVRGLLSAFSSPQNFRFVNAWGVDEEDTAIDIRPIF